MLSEKMIEETTRWFASNGRKTAVLGISGGKDSAVVAALLAQALGPEQVVGVMIPNGAQRDIADSKLVVEALGIRSIEVNIGAAYDALQEAVERALGFDLPKAAAVNVPPRLRMTTLYAVAQALSEAEGAAACVVGTGNAAELYVGYCTKWGDMASDFNPLKELWVDEVLTLGDELGYFPSIVHKAPEDGLCGLTDEERLGFTYADVRACAMGISIDEAKRKRIADMHSRAAHKIQQVPCCSNPFH